MPSYTSFVISFKVGAVNEHVSGISNVIKELVRVEFQKSQSLDTATILVDKELLIIRLYCEEDRFGDTIRQAFLALSNLKTVDKSLM